MYVPPSIDRVLWNLSCDIAVENLITELDLRDVSARRQTEQQQVVRKLRDAVNYMTAEKIYRYLSDAALSESNLLKLQKLFLADDHAVWYLPPDQQQRSQGNSLDSNSQQSNSDSQQSNSDSQQSNSDSQQSNSDSQQSNSDSQKSNLSGQQSDSRSQSRHPAAGVRSSISRAEQEAFWKTISERMQVDMETFAKEKGDHAGSMMQNLKAVNREKYDYTAFLKKFAVMGEAMKINDDEFDYIFYTYGLNLYKKMPLIEPLEYKDVKRIREFAIIIDTSGSVSGELVQTFIKKTYNILKNTESFFSKINLHIVQCDVKVQEAVKITSQDEFDKYLNNMKLKGFGGTDFRPAFSYVDELVKTGEFTRLKGVIYFTDGWGIFPERKPAYDAAFVFIRQDDFNPNVPPWAIKLVLDKDDISSQL